MSIANQVDRHSHQLHGLTPALAISPRTQGSLEELQQRRDRAYSARNRAEAGVIFATNDLRLATLRFRATEIVRFTNVRQAALDQLAAATAEYDAVVAEIQELIEAELGAEWAGAA